MPKVAPQTRVSRFALLLATALSGCTAAKVATRPVPPRTCVVLSVGGTKGLAHLGALRAVQRAGLSVDCVVGNSMGALAGGLYASAPSEDPPERFRRFVHAYDAESRREAGNRGAQAGVVVGLFTGLLTGGLGVPLMAGVGSGLAAAATTEPMEHDRFVHVLDAFVERRTVEELPVPFVTQVQVREGQGVRIEDRAAGNLAQAVGGSVANPFIFRTLDVRGAQGIDPGLDRASATPVEDACRLFPDAKLVAINVTGQPVFHSAAMRCPLLEVKVDMVERRVEDAFRPGATFDQAVEAGDRATAAALESQAWTFPADAAAEPVKN